MFQKVRWYLGAMVLLDMGGPPDGGAAVKRSLHRSVGHFVDLAQENASTGHFVDLDQENTSVWSPSLKTHL